ncbi:hypothetical protein TRSC58_07356 [Trypanosoma rangeli SC58]|uniref:Uncharacterized protein n=1 Tax=Trypanosoma rangeli SC58 TaxID=429131 RepID=A0A061IRN2_TRYRA|nr:hypothetical protein TRSC58_07356 [Trypanosoma rangeli SC58]
MMNHLVLQEAFQTLATATVRELCNAFNEGCGGDVVVSHRHLESSENAKVLLLQKSQQRHVEFHHYCLLPKPLHSLPHSLTVDTCRQSNKTRKIGVTGRVGSGGGRLTDAHAHDTKRCEQQRRKEQRRKRKSLATKKRLKQNTLTLKASDRHQSACTAVDDNTPPRTRQTQPPTTYERAERRKNKVGGWGDTQKKKKDVCVGCVK